MPPSRLTPPPPPLPTDAPAPPDDMPAADPLPLSAPHGGDDGGEGESDLAERALRLEGQADALLGMASLLRGEAAGLRDSVETEARARAEREAEREAADTARALQGDAGAMREAILRYAVACGAVDVQVAMLRARGTAGANGPDPAVTAALQRCLEEQQDASNALRALAREFQGK